MTTAELAGQRKSALAYANEVRSDNALTKQLVGSLPRVDALRAVAAIVRDPEGHEGSLRIGQLLLAVPMFGDKALNKVAVRFGLRTHVKLRALPPGRRSLIATYLEVRASEIRP